MAPREPSWDEPQDPLDPIDPIDPIDPLAEQPESTREPVSSGRRQQTPGRSVVRSLVILAVVGAIGGGVFLYQRLQPSRVQFLNGFDVPVTLTIDSGGDPITLAIPGHGRMTETLSGQVTVTAVTDSGFELSRESIEVPRATDLVVYNVRGAAAVFIEEVVYYSDEQPIGLEREGWAENFSGHAYVERDGVDYVFEAAPMEIQIDSSRSEVSRFHFDYIGDGSWMTAVNSLISMGRQPEALDIVGAVLAFDPQNTAAQSFASYLSNQQSGSQGQVPVQK